jgi:DNA-binding transcriptional regulator YdaS (Cro superfamily)
MEPKDTGIAKAIIAMQTRAALAKAIGVSVATISRWPKIPLRYVLAVEEATKVPRHELRPDIYAQQKE